MLLSNKDLGAATRLQSQARRQSEHLPMNATFRRAWHISIALSVRSLAWQIGAASATGPVRCVNQDFVVAMNTPIGQALVIADGCGGVPHGEAASRRAALAASAIIASARCDPDEMLLRQAFEAAARRLEDLGAELMIEALEGGLRTTLIVVLASAEQLHLGWIGDGGCDLLLPCGHVDRLLAPHRPSSGDSSRLEASIGPTPHGEPSFQTIARPPNSFLLCGTDGVFDRIADGFHRDVIRAAIESAGDLQAAVNHILDQFSQVRDDVGFICDDNMTFGVIGPGSPPTLSEGFWRHA